MKADWVYVVDRPGGPPAARIFRDSSKPAPFSIDSADLTPDELVALGDLAERAQIDHLEFTLGISSTERGRP